MKHNVKIISLIILLFLATQIIGLTIVKAYLPKETLPFKIEKPKLGEREAPATIVLILFIATIVALILIKFSALRLWKLWFFLSVLFCLVVAFGAFIPEKFQILALLVAIPLTVYKVLRPNIIVHNFTEIFIYGGLAAIFVPILNIFWMVVLLIVISVYDMIAVWKTKHMIKLAKFQAKARVFAGLLIPYGRKIKKLTPAELKKLRAKLGKAGLKGLQKKTMYTKTAILGGGDIGFPLLFAGVVLKTFDFISASIVAVATTIALLILFLLAEKRKFYPAMPFLSIGCLLGYLIVYLL